MEDKIKCEKAPESRKRKRPSEWDEDETEEIEKKARLVIEEALSSSKIRVCPYCKVQVTKGPGCQMVRCVCNCIFCFRCGQDVAVCVASRCCRPFGASFDASLKSTAFKASRQLKERYPRLRFKQCCQIVADSWTAEDETERDEWGLCDNDVEYPSVQRGDVCREEGEIEE